MSFQAALSRPPELRAVRGRLGAGPLALAHNLVSDLSVDLDGEVLFDVFSSVMGFIVLVRLVSRLRRIVSL